VIRSLARLLRRVFGGAGRGVAPSAPVQTPERRIDAARERLKQTIPPPDDAPAGEP
jgi:hypothetical protein